MLTDCDGETHLYPRFTFAVFDNCQKSMDENETDYGYYSDSANIPLDNIEYTIHPNPNNGSFTIKTNSLESIEKLEVVNLLGQVVYTVQYPNEKTITLPTGAKGAFFVRIITQRESITKKIIVE